MALTITVNISDDQQTCLANCVVDIDDWVQSAVSGKINHCRKMMVRGATVILRADPAVTTMPADDDGLIAALVARPAYQTLAEVEA